MPSTNPFMESQIAADLEAAGIGTLGTDIIVGELPSTPDNAIMVLPAPGPEPDKYLDTQTLHIDIFVRNVSTKAGRLAARAIYNRLHQRSNVSMGDMYVFFIGALSDIVARDRDGQDRPIYQVSFEVIYSDRSN